VADVKETSALAVLAVLEHTLASAVPGYATSRWRSIPLNRPSALSREPAEVRFAVFRGGVLPALAKTRQVIAVDPQGHGRTTLGDRPINLIDIANDLAVVLDRLGYKQVDVAGYSFGGGAALRLAIQHPTVVRRLVVASGRAASSPRCCHSRRQLARRWPSR
jgi:pimeloyl-ACP methyl ester carboxylesterase